MGRQLRMARTRPSRRCVQLHADRHTENKTSFSHLQRTDASSASIYFSYYSSLQHQQNMLQDFVRTGVYQAAISLNRSDFEGKTGEITDTLRPDLHPHLHPCPSAHANLHAYKGYCDTHPRPLQFHVANECRAAGNRNPYRATSSLLVLEPLVDWESQTWHIT
jgi:hypothetical protein